MRLCRSYQAKSFLGVGKGLLFSFLFCDTLALMSLPRTLSTTLDHIARKAVGKDWSLYAALLDHWPEIVGQDYAKKAAPVKISFPKGKKADEKWASRRTDGTLIIRLPQGLAMEFGFLSETLKSRINGFFGYPAIGRIALETYYPTAPQPFIEPPQPLSAEKKENIARQAAGIENEELREVLQQLGESVIRKPE